MQGLGKAFRLEMRHILESNTRFFSHLLIPIMIGVVLAEAGAADCSFCYGYTYFDFYASLIFSTSMIFISTQLMVLRIVGERAPYGTLDRDLLAISKSGMFLGKFLAGVVISLIQCVLFLGVGEYYNMTMKGSLYVFLLLLFMLSLVGLLLGLLFSVFTKTKEQAVQLVPFVVLILLVLSGDLIPVIDMPSLLGQIATNSPITLANESLRKVMLEGKTLQDVFAQIIKLLTWILGLLIVGIIKFTTEKR
ncbi:MAG: ABC transporter permease [Candidatus Hydrothermarchaeales archaeon]